MAIACEKLHAGRAELEAPYLTCLLSTEVSGPAGEDWHVVAGGVDHYQHGSGAPYAQQGDEDPLLQDANCSTYELVVRVLGRSADAPGNAAVFPGEAGVETHEGFHTLCSVCKKEEGSDNTILCDKCDRSFHTDCVKIDRLDATHLDEWLCLSCAVTGDTWRWQLTTQAKRVAKQADEELDEDSCREIEDSCKEVDEIQSKCDLKQFEGLQNCWGYEPRSEATAIEDLRNFVSNLGGTLEDGWQVRLEPKTRAGTRMHIRYVSPSNVLFKTRRRVAEYLGLVQARNLGKLAGPISSASSTLREARQPSAEATVSIGAQTDWCLGVRAGYLVACKTTAVTVADSPVGYNIFPSASQDNGDFMAAITSTGAAKECSKMVHAIPVTAETVVISSESIETTAETVLISTESIETIGETTSVPTAIPGSTKQLQSCWGGHPVLAEQNVGDSYVPRYISMAASLNAQAGTHNRTVSEGDAVSEGDGAKCLIESKVVGQRFEVSAIEGCAAIREKSPGSEVQPQSPNIVSEGKSINIAFPINMVDPAVRCPPVSSQAAPYEMGDEEKQDLVSTTAQPVLPLQQLPRAEGFWAEAIANLEARLGVTEDQMSNVTSLLWPTTEGDIFTNTVHKEVQETRSLVKELAGRLSDMEQAQKEEWKEVRRQAELQQTQLLRAIKAMHAITDTTNTDLDRARSTIGRLQKELEGMSASISASQKTTSKPMVPAEGHALQNSTPVTKRPAPLSPRSAMEGPINPVSAYKRRLQKARGPQFEDSDDAQGVFERRVSLAKR